MRSLIAIFGLVVSMFGSGANAAETANELYHKCNSANTYDLLYCNGYLEGVFDAVQIDIWIIKKDFTNQTARRVFIKRLDDRPELGDQTAGGVLLQVMREKGFIVKRS